MLSMYLPQILVTGCLEMWLPQSAELYSDWKGRRIHRRHSFSNYILCSVDEKQSFSELNRRRKSEQRTER